jgi:glycosyltransferase involved in cell wall biosynthesis
MATQKKSCLIVSFGPIPTPKYQKIEGGGMRCWGLALGLKAQGYDVTVGINNNFPLDVHEVDNIHLINWQEDESFKSAINAYDVVIVNYSMGGPMSFIVDNIADQITLILDCYVPIYIEVSARDSNDKVTEYSNYSHDILHYNKALKRGDYFLCANVPQKHLYTGVLSALGIINPYSYEKERILVVPFGVESSLSIANPHNPYLGLGIDKKDFVLLWFGGLYPWFNIKPLLNTIKKLSSEHSHFKFVIVGGKNPYNSHPDFVKQYDTTHDFMSKHKLLNTSVHFVDWVDFSDRVNWYQHAKAVISLNNVGEENIYSWRTRVMDYVWGEVPMLTNGGDPLSDSLLSSGAAIPLKDTEESTLYGSISEIMNKPAVLTNTKKELLKQKESYYWENVVKPIHSKLLLDEQPYLDEKLFVQEFKPDTVELVETGGIKHKLQRLARAPRKIAGIVKRKGLKRSVKLILSTSSNRLKKVARRSNRRYYFFSHPIDHTGAPLVLLDVIKDYAAQVDKKDISLVYPGGERSLLNQVFRLGIHTDKMVMGIGTRVIHAQLGIKKDDFVLLNTVALYPNYRDYILGLLEKGRLNKAVWFIHEDKPELRFDDKGLVRRVKRLIGLGLIDIVVPSKQTADDYNSFFDTDSVRVITLRVTVPVKYTEPRSTKDFDKLRFVISGTPSDGRKGQLIAISAFSKYINEYYAKNPDKYRDFELNLIAVGEKNEDYISTQIRSIGDGLLGNKIHYYPKLSKLKAMEVTYRSNVTICCSLNETFALFVAEGMLMNHVILRNHTSGFEEQLRDGINGFSIDEGDLNDFASKIAQLLDKDMSGATLKEMGSESQKIADKYLSSNYFHQLK